MGKKNGNVRMLILMISAALFVVFAVSVVAYLAGRQPGGQGVTLPPADWNSGSDNPSLFDGFVTVTQDNAAQLVLSLERPDSYCQTLTQTAVSGRQTTRMTTELWVSEGVWRIITSTGRQVRNVLTDGKTAYLWYQDDLRRVRSVTLPQDVTPDDLAGILTYEMIGRLPAEEIVQAEYRLLEELDSVPTLFVSCKNEALVETKFWVDLATGLLCKAESVLADDQVSQLIQTDLVVLDRSDQALRSQLLLPDGTDPFTASGEKPQG